MSDDLLVDRVKVYRDDAGEWRWTALAGNGRKLADSGEGYEDHAYAVELAGRLFPDAELTEGSE